MADAPDAQGAQDGDARAGSPHLPSPSFPVGDAGAADDDAGAPLPTATSEREGELRTREAALQARAAALEAREATLQAREAALDAHEAALAGHTEALREVQTRFEQMTANVRDVFWLGDPVANRVLYVNPAFEQLWGVPAEALYADVEVLTARIHPDDRAAALAAFGRMREQGHEEIEYRIVRPDGTVRWVLSRTFPVHDASGRVVRLTGVASDVTERRAADAALRESEARFRQLADNVGEMFWLVELGATLETSRVIYMNAAYARITGRAVDALPDAPALGLDRVAVEDRPAVIAAARAVAAGEWRTVEYRLTTADGASRTVRSRMAPIRDASGRVFRIGGFTEDVTEQRTLEERLRQAQKMEAVGQLAGGVAHDFNNLITVIAGNLEFVRAELPADLPVASRLRADLAEMAEAAARAATLVRQLLAFSRKQPVLPRPVQLGALVQGAERLLRRVIGEEIALAVHVDAAAGADALTVHADPGQLEQVLMNLAVNARDAMRTARHGTAGNGGTLDVEVSAERRADGGAGGADVERWVRLVVRDTGHGMTPEEQRRAFEPFYTTKPDGQGTGLGLATVFGIVTQAHGTVELDSAPGRGCTFTIRLPALRPTPDAPPPLARGGASGTIDGAASREAAHEAAHEAVRQGVRQGVRDPVRPPRRAPAPGGGRAPHATILLVEDEAPVRTTARRMLERSGYAVLEARHGADALRLWRRQGGEIDAVVTDLRMPEMGGRELTTRLRALRRTLPVVLISGYADDGTVGAGEHGQVFLEKPFTTEALLRALARALGPEASPTS